MAAAAPSCLEQPTDRASLEDERVNEDGSEAPAGSCLGHEECNGQSAGQCWCDEQCVDYGDCCADYGAVCWGDDGAAEGGTADGGEADGGPLDGTSCVGFCDGVSPDGCGCSVGCELDGTCCDDYPAVCQDQGECTKKVVLMGYWPPTNEMLRPWSTNPEQNPGEWVGKDWRGLGYDVYAFFPEFPPDGDPSNDPIGSDGSVGSADFDLRVDYQATSADFWRIVDDEQPVIVITTSRGGGIGWEVEAIEGGHGGNGSPDSDWSSDRHGDQTHPTQDSIDPRSWDAISKWRGDDVLPTKLPVDAIVEAADALGLVSVEVDSTGTSGSYLSGFLGLHGLAYAELHPEVLAAGHIHVGRHVPNDEANQLMEATLEAVLKAHPSATASCPSE
ncbi:MAG: hypothetical protein AB1Z98_10330 [Nannocystaceae bacterium]